MEPAGDGRKAAGEQSSSLRLQWRAAHRLASQRQAGELILNPDVEELE